MTSLDREAVGQRIARARRRRGLSQAVLAGLVGRSESWLSQAERGIDSHSVLVFRLAKVLRVATRYDATGRILPGLIRDVEIAIRIGGSAGPAACAVRALVYDTAAALLSRVGEPFLAWAASDRAMAAASIPAIRCSPRWARGVFPMSSPAASIRNRHSIWRCRSAAHRIGRQAHAGQPRPCPGVCHVPEDAAAVNLLLAAERLSPQLVRYDQTTRDVLTELLRREHRPSTPELRPLARRAGVI